MSFRLKTILGIGLIQAVLLLLLIFMVLNFVKTAQNRDIIDRAQTTINIFATTSRDAILSSDLDTLDSASHEILENPAIVYVRILDANQQVMASAGSKAILDTEFKADSNLVSAQLDGIFDIASNITVGDVTLGTIQLGLSTENLLKDIQQIQNYSLGVASIEILLMVILSFALGSWLTHQLTLLKQAADTIASGELGHSVRVSGNDEIAHTVRAFNSMSNKLRQTEDRRQQTMRQLEHAEEQSRLLLTSAAEGIIEVDEKLAIVFANPAAREMLGADNHANTLPENINYLFEHNNERIASIHHCLENEATIHVEDTLCVTIDGKYLNIEYTCAPIKKDNMISGAVIIFSDISKRKEAEEAIIRAHRAELENAQAKADFMSNVSHELRTPMNGIIGLLQLIDKNRLPEPYAEYLSAAEDAAYKLMKLIEDILDITAINSDRLKLASIDLHMKQTIDECIQANRRKAEQKGLDLILHYHASHDWVMGDRARLQQVLNNIIDNAIKFTHEGKIVVSVETVDVNNRFINYRFSVKDTGIGIARKHQPGLFNYFHQADASITREYGGVGIGLSICYSLIKKMGGSIHVMSKLGKGSEFTIELPFLTSKLAKEAEEYQPGPEIDYPQFKGHVLLVDDNPVNQVVSSQVCKLFGLTYRIAENGKQALDEYNNDHFDLIFMDLHMPVMNGYETTQQIRAQETEDQHQVIIALTVNASDKEIKQCQLVGFDDFMSKPLHQQDMEKILEYWLKDKRIQSPA